MRRAMRAGGALVGLAVLVAGLNGGVAKAGALKTGIIVRPGAPVKQVGDPQYELVFEILAKPETEIWPLIFNPISPADSQPADYIEFFAIPNVRENSTYNTPNGTPSGPWATTIENVSSPFGANVIFSYAAAPFVNASLTDPALLGFFKLITVSIPELPPGTTFTIGWEAKVHDLQGNVEMDRGTVTLSMVPEPASVVLLGVALPGLLYVRRRRASRRSRLRPATA